MTDVKICGLTRPEDVRLACELGAAYVGFNFAAASPRRVTLARARELARAAAPTAKRVGVFVDESWAEIADAVEAGDLHLLQIHRPVSEEDLQNPPRPVIAVVRVAGSSAPVPPAAVLKRCRSLLFDAAAPGGRGGTGACFDWSALEGKSFPVPVFLAGGLTPDNVAEAIRRVRPAAVDVASGVESAPGIKDPDSLRRFFEAVRQADSPPRQARA